MLPSFIAGWDGETLKARVAFRMPNQEILTPPETALERRYALRAVKAAPSVISGSRNHRLRRSLRSIAPAGTAFLLDAAHIVEDRDEQLGQPVIPNGIPLLKIHHAAFDAHLIGIDPDYRLHVSERSDWMAKPSTCRAVSGIARIGTDWHCASSDSRPRAEGPPLPGCCDAQHPVQEIPKRATLAGTLESTGGVRTASKIHCPWAK
jgi:hypothetical protein